MSEIFYEKKENNFFKKMSEICYAKMGNNFCKIVRSSVILLLPLFDCLISQFWSCWNCPFHWDYFIKTFVRTTFIYLMGMYPKGKLIWHFFKEKITSSRKCQKYATQKWAITSSSKCQKYSTKKREITSSSFIHTTFIY
jgi:hypothetical protein